MSTAKKPEPNTEPLAEEADGFSKKHALTFITITLFIDAAGFGVIMPVLPQLLMELSGEGLSSASKWSGWLIDTDAARCFWSLCFCTALII